MRLQDEERRHIARELHDTCGQTLAAMKMSIAQIRQLENSNPALDVLIDDLNALTDSTLQDVRTTSYLLHPPLLDEAGIPSAIRWFTEGFASRSGIKVQCEIGPNMGRSPREFELVLFRVLQESLTNVHRHSGASAATVRLQRNAEQIQLEIRDNGRGIAQERLRALDASEPKVGVGITGMRERVHQLGGHLELLSNASGTTVSVMLPLSDSQDSTRPDSISIAR
jgi:signal transduction histidine kinase